VFTKLLNIGLIHRLAPPELATKYVRGDHVLPHHRLRRGPYKAISANGATGFRRRHKCSLSCE
jgi:hypothetical protein